MLYRSAISTRSTPQAQWAVAWTLPTGKPSTFAPPGKLFAMQVSMLSMLMQHHDRCATLLEWTQPAAGSGFLPDLTVLTIYMQDMVAF